MKCSMMISRRILLRSAVPAWAFKLARAFALRLVVGDRRSVGRKLLSVFRNRNRSASTLIPRSIPVWGLPGPIRVASKIELVAVAFRKTCATLCVTTTINRLAYRFCRNCACVWPYFGKIAAISALWLISVRRGSVGSAGSGGGADVSANVNQLPESVCLYEHRRDDSN